MTEPKKSTSISGVKYEMSMLTGREARTVGLLVTAAALRGIAVAVGKADLSKLLKQLPELGNVTNAKFLENLSWPEISAALGGLADGGATLLEMIRPDGLEVISNAFTAHTTVWVPSDHPGAGGQTFPTPLTNREDHWVGRWPQYLQWLAWETKENGFFPGAEALGISAKSANGSAGDSAQPQVPTASA